MSEANRRVIDDASRHTDMTDVFKLLKSTSDPTAWKIALDMMQLRMQHELVQRLGEIASAIEAAGPIVRITCRWRDDPSHIHDWPDCFS